MIEHPEAVLVGGLARAVLQRCRACFARGGRGLAVEGGQRVVAEGVGGVRPGVLAVEISVGSS